MAFPTARTRRSRLKAAALEGERGRDWYKRAELGIRKVARSWGVSPAEVAVAVAGTSPATPVISSSRMTRGGGSGSNIGKARRVVKAWSRGQSYAEVLDPKSPGATRLAQFEQCGRTGPCVQTAFPDPETTKTHAFVRNLLGDTNSVTVDTLIFRGATHGEGSLTKARYRLLVEDIRAVARDLGWEPRQVMAAAWTAWGGTGELLLPTRKESARKNPRTRKKNVRHRR